MHPNETYVNGTWPVNNLKPGSSSNSVPSSPWSTSASQDRLLENLQHSNSMYSRCAVPAGEHYHLSIENQLHLNSTYSKDAGPSVYLTDNVQVGNPVYPECAELPGEVNYLFANQQFSSVMHPIPGSEQNFYIDDSEQVGCTNPIEDAVTGEWYPEELDPVDCNNQIALELAELNYHSYHSDVWLSQAAGGGEPGASSSASVPEAFSCQTVCSTPEPEASLSPIATDPSTDKSWHVLPAEHRFTSSEVATSAYHEGVSTKKKKKARKWQCEVRISKKLRSESDDMIQREKLWITFDRAEQADRAKQVSKFLLSRSKTKYVDTQFDPPEFDTELRALRAAVQENGVDAIMYGKVKELAEWYGKLDPT